MKRLTVTLVAVAIATSVLATDLQATQAAQPTVVRGGTVTHACDQSSISTLDPATSTFSNCQQDALTAMYDALLRNSPKGETGPGLATSWKYSNKNRTITFKLRSGVLFHDGSPVTAEAVKFSILRALRYPATSGRFIDGVVRRVSAPNSTTVVVTLFAPNFLVPYNLASAWAVPILNPKVVAANNDNISKVDAGSGPFMLESVDLGTNGSATFKRFDRYWEKGADGKPLPYLDGWKLVARVDNTARVLNLKSKTVDSIESTPTASIKDLRDNGFRQLNNYSGVGASMIMNERVSPFDNPIVRLAVVQALDRYAIAKTWSLGTAVVRPHQIAVGSIYDVKGVDFAPYDVNAAKANLGKAGLPNGFSTTMTIINRDPDGQVAQLVQQYLAAVGIKVTIKVLDRAAWLTEVAKGQTPMFQQAGNALVQPDLAKARVECEGAAFDRGRWCDRWQKAALNAMVKAAQEPDPQKRKKWYEVFVKNWVAANTWIFFGNAPAPNFTVSNLRGVVINPETDVDFSRAWFAS